jgi:hypothetical protein
MITTKGMELTPKLSTDMLPFSRNPLLTPLLMDFSIKTPRNGSGSLGAYQGKKKALRMKWRGGLFIEKIRHQLPDKAADVRQP